VSAIIANTSAIALSLRPWCDERIIALPVVPISSCQCTARPESERVQKAPWSEEGATRTRGRRFKAWQRGKLQTKPRGPEQNGPAPYRFQKLFKYYQFIVL
jgi:hypothetical protein